MQEEQGPVRAPEFPANVTWLQGGPFKLADLRGRPVLIDFWDYTCVNCLRTLPYVNEWHRRYGPLGLTVVGVHAPEFSFARDAGNVQRSVREQGIDYPVVLDNDYAIWQAYTNRYWPAKYLVDGHGYLRYYHHGEGAYAETEGAIQRLLKESFPQILLPALMDPVRAEDATGALCYRVTPELYLGYQRGLIGNVAGVIPDHPSTYRDPGKHLDGNAYLDGDWLLAGEYLARPAGASGTSQLIVPYMAKEVNLVIHPPTYGGTATFSVQQDGAALAPEDAGADVVAGDTVSLLSIDAPRLYRIVNNREIDRHELTLTTTSDGVALYAFTFTSCLVPSEGGDSEPLADQSHPFPPREGAGD
ncbi:MAG: redoxin domain-containing protein [Chloroflexota bacterium]|nr:redoxin domain-containing protein [Chloroflexota bacterium]